MDGEQMIRTPKFQKVLRKYIEQSNYEDYCLFNGEDPNKIEYNLKQEQLK